MNCKSLARGAFAGSLLIAIWGCARFGGTNRSTAVPSGGKPVASGPAANGGRPVGGDPRSELVAALRNRNNAPSYKMEGSASQSNGTSYTIVAEFQSPDRFHVVRTGQVAGMGSQKGETIGIGSETWLKKDDGAWRKSPIHIDLAGTLFGAENVEELAKDSSAEIKYLGTESISGSEMNVYEYSGERKDEDSGVAIKLTGKYWVGVADKLPHKMEGETDSDQDGKTATSRISEAYDYDAAVKIEPPQ